MGRQNGSIMSLIYIIIVTVVVLSSGQTWAGLSLQYLG